MYIFSIYLWKSSNCPKVFLSLLPLWTRLAVRLTTHPTCRGHPDWLRANMWQWFVQWQEPKPVSSLSSLGPSAWSGYDANGVQLRRGTLSPEKDVMLDVNTTTRSFWETRLGIQLALEEDTTKKLWEIGVFPQIGLALKPAQFVVFSGKWDNKLSVLLFKLIWIGFFCLLHPKTS